MGSPAVVVSILAKSRTVRRLLLTLFCLFAMVLLVVTAPLAVVSVAAMGSSATVVGAPPGGQPVTIGDWGYPLAGDYFKGRGFGYNPVEGCWYCSKNHLGYDMSQGCGSTIYAAGSGTVITAGPHYGWGNAVRIDHGRGVETLYGHMQWDSLRVRVGDQVSVGTPLGAEGNTGKSHGCHLHYEVRQDGTAIDPEPFMAALGLPLK